MRFRLLFAALGVAAAPALAQGPDVRVNGDPPGRVQNETSLLLDWLRPGNLIVAFNDNPYPGTMGIGVGRSIDGGLTWNAINLPPLAGMVDAFDPITAEDANGWVYVGCVSTSGMTPGTSMISLWGSADGGANWIWGMPIAVDLTNLLDKPHLEPDLDPVSPNYGSLYAAWIRDFAAVGPWSDIYFAYNRNTPPVFAIPQRISDQPPGVARSFGPNITTTSDGWVHVVWLDFDVTTGGQTPGMIFIDSSADGGVTWGVDRPVMMPPIITVPNRLSNFATPMSDVVARSFPVIDASPTNPMELYVVWPADPDGPFVGDETDVFFTKSTDRGFTWSMPIVLNSFSGGHEFAPWIAVEPNGTIDVAWYEAGPNDLGPQWAVMLTRSLDGGATWTTPIPINDLLFPSPRDPWNMPWLGEYLGLAVDANGPRLAFTSSVSDYYGDIYFDWRRACAEDLNGDFLVDFNDLLVLLSAWGPAPNNPADFDGNGFIDFQDLLQLLSRWGPC